ncbi:phytoene desaturase family protein [Falsiroseomonas selenitidurans]|uniref:Phytoene desaturase n=1 Tax=Falsiroseomonas selenitidurans TaxID=2716335 RepID=A0ABX1E6E0_9PROT|nr:phytoene desaturase family protein [Falsiroseomonas selenitidurans]NKC32754.1 phytoene desaturase [Falsiroseomonas selenitidurans]
MTAPLSSPALHRPRPKVAVIGAGPGGLAAAMLLAASGARVTVYEKDSVVGGRTRTLTSPEGYSFDLGPTFFLYPRILKEIFSRCGAELESEVDLRRLEPQYRLIFEQGSPDAGNPPTRIDASADMARMEAEIARISPEDARGLRPFMAENRAKLEAFRPVLERAFSTAADMVRPDMLKALPLMKPWSTVDRDLARHFKDPRVRLAFSFQTKYLGMSPFKCPALFTILSFLEYEHGVFHPIGGCGAVSDAMARVAQRLGAEIRLDTPVEGIAFEGRRARGVDVGGRVQDAEAVVVNADFAHAIPKLIPDHLRKRGWTDRKIGKAKYSCSTFMLYLGLDKELPGVAHHNVILSEQYRENIGQIERGEIPEIPSLYVQHAGATDPTLAPAGHTALYVLVPAPNLIVRPDWSAHCARFREIALDRLKVLGHGDLRPHIRYERIVAPPDWESDFGVGFGATFNLSHELPQMLLFRPGNRFREVEGVYLVGGGTHPGSGLPVIYEGARITTGLLAKDLGLSGAPSRPTAESGFRAATPVAAES